MSATFKRVSVEQFAGLLDRFPFSRTITAVHMHHTWRPDHKDFKGHDSIVAMWRYHTEHHGWSDIAQHITIDPEGYIWLGRDWNKAPASARHYNGDSKAGPFMFEMIGDFDIGRDKFAGKQRDTVLQVIAMLQDCFSLPPESLKFHSTMSGKTCPGNSIDYQQTLQDVARLRVRDASQRGAERDHEPPFQPDTYASNLAIEQVLSEMKRAGQRADAEAEADACAHHHHDDSQPVHGGSGASVAGLSRGPAPDLLPHLVNLSMGELSGSGAWSTSRADVDAIFHDHLPRALERAQARGLPLRLMFQAHGGLTDEATGLAVARKSVAWWLENGIYPIYFAWETGLFESIGQLLKRAVSGQRDLADYTTDPLVQEAVRLLGAPKIWGVMKQNAQVASAPDTVGNSRQAQAGREGGGYYVAMLLAGFCKRYGNKVELHAVGHSAGAIFHAWFMSAALELGVPGFRSLHLMAPAIRVDLFKDKLGSLVGAHKGIDELTVYTMKDDEESDDTCAGIYRKSLLYLIFHALEPQRSTPILGLEESLRADGDLSRLFGLSGAPGKAEVIWSRTPAQKGRSASNATTHGGFDDDASTMGSIARRILNKGDSDSIVEYKGAASGVRAQPQHRPDSPILLQDRSGTRRALCVGINDYARIPLSGCLSDVESWSRSLANVGFTVTPLLNERATRAAIIENLERMISESQTGDVLVFQYSGHGTSLPDLNDDEDDGKDEALVPYDYETGAFLLDDELGRMYARVPEGVNLTCFMDCCHSGSNSRFLSGAPFDPTARSRFLPTDPQLVAAHRRFRETVAAERGAPVEAPVTQEVSFAACSPSQSAWESGGQGEFTVRATAILDGGLDKLTNSGFMAQIIGAFGENPRQQPQLDGQRAAIKRPLLQPLGAAPNVAAKEVAVTASPDIAQLLDLLGSVQQLLQGQLQQAGVKGKAGRKAVLRSPPPLSMQHSDRQNR